MFVDTGDVITVYVLEQEGMQAPEYGNFDHSVAELIKTVTLGDPGAGVARSGTYTILRK